MVSCQYFPDTLSIASYAATQGIPILLSERDVLPNGVQDYLQENKVSKAYIVGGEGVIAKALESHLPNPERIAGSDRYESNLEVLNKFSFNFTNTFLATGENFPDALSGVTLASSGRSPILLVSDNVNEPIRRTWRFNKDLMKTKIILGGDGVISDNLSSYFYIPSYKDSHVDFLFK